LDGYGPSGGIMDLVVDMVPNRMFERKPAQRPNMNFRPPAWNALVHSLIVRAGWVEPARIGN
jgi:hypothetical protein